MNESIEKIQSGREKLKNLEAEGKYVFHGSENSNIDLFEPRQAYNYKTGTKEPDGEPAVFASSEADYAIVMSLINKKNCPNGFHSSLGTSLNEKGEEYLCIRISKKAIEQLDENSIGYVYFFDKNNFVQSGKRKVEYKSMSEVPSIDVVAVTKADLPPNIEIIE